MTNHYEKPPTTIAERVFKGIRGLVINLSKETEVSEQIIASHILDYFEQEFIYEVTRRK